MPWHVRCENSDAGVDDERPEADVSNRDVFAMSPPIVIALGSRMPVGNALPRLCSRLRPR